MNPDENLIKIIKDLEYRLSVLESERRDTDNRVYSEKQQQALEVFVGKKLHVGYVNNTRVPYISSGTGIPTFEAPNGSLWMRTNGGSQTSLWVNYSGSSWQALGT